MAAYHAGSEEDQIFWRRTIEASEQSDDDLEHALVLMARTGAIDTTLARAGVYAERAKEALGCFAPSVVRSCLVGVADYTVRRGR